MSAKRLLVRRRRIDFSLSASQRISVAFVCFHESQSNSNGTVCISSSVWPPRLRPPPYRWVSLMSISKAYPFWQGLSFPAAHVVCRSTVGQRTKPTQPRLPCGAWPVKPIGKSSARKLADRDVQRSIAHEVADDPFFRRKNTRSLCFCHTRDHTVAFLSELVENQQCSEHQ